MEHPHTQLKADIRVALTKDPDVLILNNAGGFDETKKIRYGLGEGSPDLVGWIKPSGRGFCIEVKTGTGRLAAKQKMWILLLRNFGVYAAVARSVEDALMHKDRAKAGLFPEVE